MLEIYKSEFDNLEFGNAYNDRQNDNSKTIQTETIGARNLENISQIIIKIDFRIDFCDVY